MYPKKKRFSRLTGFNKEQAARRRNTKRLKIAIEESPARKESSV